MRLHFDLAVTQRLLDHSKAATERSPTCDQLYEGRFRRDGKGADLDNLSAGNLPAADDVDPTKIPPGLWLIGDHGIYLMSNGRPPLRPEAGESFNIVAHAPEADPRVDPEGWWEVKRAPFGGDDGVVFLELAFAEGLIARGRDGRVCVDITPAQVEAVVQPCSSRRWSRVAVEFRHGGRGGGTPYNGQNSTHRSTNQEHRRSAIRPS